MPPRLVPPPPSDLARLWRRLVLDHCHKTNKVRGWLCNKCNVILGMADDDVDRLAALIAYVKEA